MGVPSYQERLNELNMQLGYIDNDIIKLEQEKTKKKKYYLDRNGSNWVGQIIEITYPNSSIPKETIHIIGKDIGLNARNEWDIFYLYKKALKNGRIAKNGTARRLFQSTIDMSDIDIIFENLQDE